MAGLHLHRSLAVLSLLSCLSLAPRPAGAAPRPLGLRPGRALSPAPGDFGRPLQYTPSPRSDEPQRAPPTAPPEATQPQRLPDLPPPRPHRVHPAPGGLSVDAELSLGYAQRLGTSDYLGGDGDELDSGSSAAAAVGVSLAGQQLTLDATFDLTLGLLRGDALNLPGRAGAQDKGPLWRLGGRLGYQPPTGRQGPLLRLGLSYARAALSVGCGSSCPVAQLRATGLSPELALGFRTQPLASQPHLQVFAIVSYAPLFWLSAEREDGAGRVYADLPTAGGDHPLGQGHGVSHLLRIQIGLRFGWVPPQTPPPAPR